MAVTDAEFSFELPGEPSIASSAFIEEVLVPVQPGWGLRLVELLHR